MIIIEPMGGLANRMRVIASGIALKEALNRPLIIIWNENNELNCPFGLLFEDEQLFTIQKKRRKYNFLRTSKQPTFVKSVSAAIVNRAIGIGRCLQDHDLYLPGGQQLDVHKEAGARSVIYIQTCQAFGNYEACLGRFRPIGPIAEKIREVACKFTSFTVGVHIRRTDHERSKERSPTGVFIARMRDELALQPEATFFVCTDDPEVESAIVAVFGTKVFTYAKEQSRKTVKGMEDAVVDLFCLARTAKIFGSYWSSYSEVAAAIHGVPLEVLTQ